MDQVNLGTIAANDSVTGTIVVVQKRSSEGTVTNTATVASDLQDPNLGNNTSTLGPTYVAGGDLLGRRFSGARGVSLRRHGRGRDHGLDASGPPRHIRRCHGTGDQRQRRHRRRVPWPWRLSVSGVHPDLDAVIDGLRHGADDRCRRRRGRRVPRRPGRAAGRRLPLHQRRRQLQRTGFVGPGLAAGRRRQRRRGRRVRQRRGRAAAPPASTSLRSRAPPPRPQPG